MKAVIIKEAGVAAVADIPEQTLRPGYIKIRTKAFAINPTDAVHTAGVGPAGSLLGCDVSGHVVEIGSDFTTDVKVGDAVYGVCHGGNTNNKENGAFAEYALIRDGSFAKMPSNVSFEEAATLGVGVTSVGQALYMTMKLPLPVPESVKFEGKQYILIYGGSTATGSLAIQFAKLSGLHVITTASPANFDLVKSRGADAVFDYHDPECAKKIKEYTNNSLHLVMDCVSTESSYNIVADSLVEGEEGKGRGPISVVTLLPADAWPKRRSDVTPIPILAYTSGGEAFTKFGRDFPAIPQHFEHGKMFWKFAGELLAQGKFKTHPVALRDGGLSGIPKGIAEMSEGMVKACKLVYRVDDEEDGGADKSDAAVKGRELGSNW